MIDFAILILAIALVSNSVFSAVKNRKKAANGCASCPFNEQNIGKTNEK